MASASERAIRQGQVSSLRQSWARAFMVLLAGALGIPSVAFSAVDPEPSPLFNKSLSESVEKLANAPATATRPPAKRFALAATPMPPQQVADSAKYCIYELVCANIPEDVLVREFGLHLGDRRGLGVCSTGVNCFEQTTSVYETLCLKWGFVACDTVTVAAIPFTLDSCICDSLATMPGSPTCAREPTCPGVWTCTREMSCPGNPPTMCDAGPTCYINPTCDDRATCEYHPTCWPHQQTCDVTCHGSEPTCYPLPTCVYTTCYEPTCVRNETCEDETCTPHSTCEGVETCALAATCPGVSTCGQPTCAPAATCPEGQCDVVSPNVTIGVHQNPLFPAYIQIYLIMDEPVSATPVLIVENDSLQLTLITDPGGPEPIYRTDYQLTDAGTVTISAIVTDMAANVTDTSMSFVCFPGGSSGGVLRSLDRHLSLIFPEHTLTSDQYLLLFEREDPDGRVYDVRPGAMVLAENATIRIAYAASATRLAAPENLAIYRQDGFGAWQMLPTYIDADAGELVAHTDRLGVFQIRSAGQAVASPLPKSISLAQNYPNPFNTSTVIEFTLDQPGNAMLEVFNILGERVATILNETRDVGRHQVFWDGSFDHGRPAPSGVYFYRLTAHSQTQTRKMILMK